MSMENCVASMPDPAEQRARERRALERKALRQMEAERRKLRDYFAAQVLPSVFTFYATTASCGGLGGEVKYADVASMAYDIADKMLIQREK